MFTRFKPNVQPDDTFDSLHDSVVWFRNAVFSDEEIRGVGSGTRVGIMGANALLVCVTDAGLQDPIR